MDVGYRGNAAHSNGRGALLRGQGSVLLLLLQAPSFLSWRQRWVPGPRQEVSRALSRGKLLSPNRHGCGRLTLRPTPRPREDLAGTSGTTAARLFLFPFLSTLSFPPSFLYSSFFPFCLALLSSLFPPSILSPLFPSFLSSLLFLLSFLSSLPFL